MPGMRQIIAAPCAFPRSSLIYTVGVTSRDFPLPIADAAAQASAWPAVEQEPINYIAAVPGEHPPALEDVIAALSREVGAAASPLGEFTIVDQPQAQSPAVWNALIAGPGWASPIVLWVEPMRRMSPENVEYLKVGSCRWAIGVETMLPFDEPHVHLHRLLRMLGRAFADSPAILNVNTGAWHTRHELEQTLLPAEIEASPALAFLVHVINGEPAADGAEHLAFAFTDGLHSTGRAELEMHGIDAADGRTAAGFLNAIAELIVENGLPEPDQPLEIGVDAFVRFMPASQVAEAAQPGALGGAHQRVDHAGEPLTGERIAVCAIDSFNWPAEAARRIQRGDSAMFRTKAATERDARIARSTLDRFAGLFHLVPAARRRSSPDRLAAFLVKAGFAVPRGSVIDDGAQESDDHREHLWFEIAEVHNGRLRGMLLNQPALVRLRPNDVVWIDRHVVSDWQVFTPKGQFGPTQHHAAEETLVQLLATPERQGDQP